MFLIAVWTIPILGSLDKMSIPDIAFQPVRKWVSCISQHFASRSFTLFSRKLYVVRLQNWFCPCKHIQMKRCTYTRTSFADVRIKNNVFHELVTSVFYIAFVCPKQVFMSPAKPIRHLHVALRFAWRIDILFSVLMYTRTFLKRDLVDVSVFQR